MTTLWLVPCQAQFAPDGGLPGSEAVHRDSAQWAGWATTVQFEAGLLDAARPQLGQVPNVSNGNQALGPVNDEVVSMGDGGVITLGFDGLLYDGPGPDLVVFENGFPAANGAFLELGFVEVSSDGEHFFRFESTNLHTEPVGPFDLMRPSLIDGLAGKVSAPYGVAFDLADLPSHASFNRDSIVLIRIVDVVGTPDTAFASFDATGAAVLDPYPTDFEAGGFDLDAVGALHLRSVTGIVEVRADPMRRSIRQARIFTLGELSGFVQRGTHRVYAMNGQAVDLQTAPRQGIFIAEPLDPSHPSLWLFVR